VRTIKVGDSLEEWVVRRTGDEDRDSVSGVWMRLPLSYRIARMARGPSRGRRRAARVRTVFFRHIRPRVASLLLSDTKCARSPYVPVLTCRVGFCAQTRRFWGQETNRP
jgi:hypothetical protein